MKAAICRDFGQPLTIEEVVLRAPGPGEVQVGIEAVAICHSDIGYLDGIWHSQLPAVYGHEAAGRITALGEGVQGLCVGDAVVVTMIRACGQCRACRLGKPYLCATRYNRANGVLSLPDGSVVEHGLDTGAFAEACVVHASQVAKVPDDLPMELGALLACGVITGTGAVINTAGVRAGENVVVIGAGGVGLNAIQGARLAGAGKIIAVDLAEEKLDAAKEFGATDVLRADMKGLRKAVMALTEGQGAEHVMVAVGAVAAYNQAASLACKGGQVVMVGMPPSGAKMEVEPVIAAVTAQSYRGSFMGATVVQRDIPYLVEMWRQGRLKLEELITARYAFEEINQAIADARQGHVRRNVIVMAR
ncbi:zinc-binding dehydrogenase [Pararhodobacter marinus]|uniref:Zinc-binding dehydrogenase n=1 Tax=Pararhodobacter marinus TaxID=2184063 RepID=A0A2U2CG03_9RHOB|nr:zinc-binding dehydrogenase [Pararhodobacter marinus]PWE30828.1 zinc-binding dehydrogenase [Pararhodobacter marinus]